MTYTDNELLIQVISNLNTFLSAYPLPGLSDPVIVQQKQQPTQTGAPVAAAAVVLIERLFDKRYGSPMISHTPAVAGVTLNEVEDQIYISTMQVSTMVRQDPDDLDRPTASDLCNIVCSMLQSRAIIRLFAAGGIGIIRVTNMRNRAFVNDGDSQEFHPSFDLNVTYTRSNVPNPFNVVPVLKGAVADAVFQFN